MIDRAQALEVRNDAGQPLVTEELRGQGVAVIRINRPERHNAWNEEVELQYEAALARAVEDAAVRSIVLTGAGDSFCPGMDRARLAEITGGGAAYMSGRSPQTLLRDVPKPVIAAVNGPCAGIGFVQAMMADLRFTARTARWSAAFARIGLVAEDGIAARLQQVAGDEVAADVLLSARVFDGDEAVCLRLASRAFDDGQVLDEAVEYARGFDACSPASLALIKRQLVGDAGARLEDARLRAVDYLARAKELPDYAEAVSAAREKRPPEFAPLDINSIRKV